jgi:prepilin-type N-terminal cleavage/methylation domain-containing protein
VALWTEFLHAFTRKNTGFTVLSGLGAGDILLVVKAISTRAPLAVGFSLVELLVVIAVIAIIAAVAIPSFSNITSETVNSKNRRNAQLVSALASSAKAAGVTNDLSSTNAIALLQPPGVSVTSGAGTMQFSLSAMTQQEQAGAALYLQAASSASEGVRYVPE